MKRHLYDKLLSWKNDPDRKPLILKGARQVGKTWLLQEFGKCEYESVAYVSCDQNELIETLFRSDFDTARILRGISAITGVDIRPGSTLVILDEIQEVPRSIQALKYFCEEAREYHICAAGSLLGIKLRGEISYPVGKVNELKLYPLDFEEFVHAVDGEVTYRHLKEAPLHELSALSGKWIELLRQYYYTGGMPEAVAAYAGGSSLSKVREVQTQILSDYNEDISKHTDKRTAIRIHQVWDSIAQQLAKENKKFVYGHIQKGARAKDYELALQWLKDAGLIYRVPCVTKAMIPLRFYENYEAFKLYYVDCGLMGALVQAPADQILIGDSIFEEYKGAFTEQYVLQQLITSYGGDIYYYHPENSRQEIDFMLQNGSRITAIEVKAEENLRSKSLRLASENTPNLDAIRLSMSDYRVQDWMTNIPLYLAARVLQ